MVCLHAAHNAALQADALLAEVEAVCSNPRQKREKFGVVHRKLRLNE
jgi:hypothetical protein